MSISRKEFLKQTAMMAAGTATLPSIFSKAIQKAYSIDPKPGSTFMDAEHVVFLMQENRSFDHCFGSLRGIRGFNDPRAINLPNGNPVWFQSNEKGETYAPFRLDLKGSRATWMGSLPHGWTSQIAARNNGKYDKWLEAKKSGNEKYADMPLTMGHYTREDIPFYYALADAFTVCDQNFCSSLTGTSPNRLYFWSGTVREEQHRNSTPHLFNGDIDYKDLTWQTFPERLEKQGIHWRVYQNELSIPVGFEGKESSWLANFTDNDLEHFAKYNVRLYNKHLEFLEAKTIQLKKEIDELENHNESAKEIAAKKKELQKLLDYRRTWNEERFSRLSDFEKRIHERAFTTNYGDPEYHKLEKLTYYKNQEQRELQIPKGDILRNFRTDVQSGNLPTVSWLVAPENFSGHPGAPWYGAWYVSEVMNILTQNPEVWKKTIFVITYDENDGYFDHIPPFVAPNPNDPDSGTVSRGIHNEVDYADDKQFDSPIGLGYRVPKLIISPWSRGGWVNSEVLDHTSDLQFLEKFLSNKTGQNIEEPKISDWRRAVCGDMTSVFRPCNGEKIHKPDFIERKDFIRQINNAKFKELPKGYRKFSSNELKQIRKSGTNGKSSYFRQENGDRPSCALPYQLKVKGTLNTDGEFNLNLEADNEIFADTSSGSPFVVYAPSGYQKNGSNKYEKMCLWNYAVKAGEEIEDSWALKRFPENHYFLQVYGPNGFFRQYKGGADDPKLEIHLRYQREQKAKNKLTGNIELMISNKGVKSQSVHLRELAYNERVITKTVDPKQTVVVPLNLADSHYWYDFRLTIEKNDLFERKFAGRVETGKTSYSDPQIGNNSPSG